MNIRNIRLNLFLIAFVTLASCNKDDTTTTTTIPSTSPVDYTGSASVSQGMATVSISNLFSCAGGRNAPIGISTATDGSTWIVPADVNFTNNSFPVASDLYNPCSGVQYNTAAEAVAALDGSDIVEIDANGEVVTAYVFADNYFEMYINGIAVGKDNVPFTQFNSNLVRFRVNIPFTIAMKLVDWEENSGLGSEDNQGYSYHAGDGGMVAVFTNSNGDILASTGSEWKAQTFYTSPIKDLACPTENGTSRLTDDCDTEGSNNGTSYYALHWEIPSNWYATTFDDSTWPSATTYTNETIGVDNKAAYTQFTDVFDNNSNDAEFIWSTNVILDNEVIVRFKVE